MALNIGMDWDDTFTADPQAFTHIIKTLQNHGHVVHIVTARNEDDAKFCERDLAKFGIEGVEVHGTTYRSKKLHMRTKGIHIDIWMDDHPLRIGVSEDREHLAYGHW